jgi:hypothetical protein
MTEVPLPLWLIGGGVVLLLLAIKVLIQQTRSIEVVPYTNVSVELPKRWDDAEIAKLLQRHASQPTVLAHAVSSIKTRMVLNQDVKTAQKRLQLLASVIEVFKLNRELQGVLHDLHLADKEFAIRQLETDIRLEDTEARQKSERRLRQLRQERDELALQSEIAQSRHDINSFQRAPAKAEAELSAEQKRAREKKACDDRLASLKAEKQKALTIEDEGERVLKVNAIDDAISREMERWARLL